jgi:uncharacterized protein (TIGR02145 family)
MKHLFTLALVLCLGTFASAQIPSYVPTNGLVGWWPFNGNANDESGNGNHGTVNGATLAADRFGIAGKAYSFDGVNDRIEINDHPDFKRNFLSISFWIKSNSFTSLGNVRSDIISKDSINARQWVVQLEQFGKIRNAIFANSEFTFDSDSSISLNIWKNVTIVWDGIKSSTFIDGKINGYINTNGPLTSFQTAINLFFGGNLSYNQFFNGLLDDIAIYNRALSPAEVQQLYLGNSSNTAAATVPGKIHYQGLAVGANRKPIKNGTVGLRLSVLDSLPNGFNLYTETQSASTDAAGIFSTYLGGGTATAGTFTNIPWANGNNKFLKVEMDAQGGTNYQNMGSTQLVSVPYALHSGSAQRATELMDSAGNAYQIKIVNGQPTLVSAPGNLSTPAPFACGQAVTYAGESYPTVQIGSQCWFAKNLNVGTMVNPSFAVDSQKNNGVIEKYCYDDNPINCVRFGGLYQWSEALQYELNNVNSSIKIKGICPDGWSIPSDSDFIYLTNYCGGLNNAGNILKSNSSWANGFNGRNDYYFSAIPTGIRYPQENYSSAGYNTFFWSTSYPDNTRILTGGSTDFFSASHSGEFGFSVRCLKD